MTRDFALFCTFAEVESTFNARAYRSDRNGGSFGLTQIDVQTAKDMGYTGDGPGLYEPYTNQYWFWRIYDHHSAALRQAGKYSLEAFAAAWNEGLNGELEGYPDPGYVSKIVMTYPKYASLYPSIAATG